jgi:Rrf2 family protein
MLPKTAEYALRAVVWLARDPGQAESADRLAAVTQVPRRYLHKVLQELVAHGLVRSSSGPRGGYALEIEPAKLTILDVVNAVAPLERIEHCPLGLPAHQTLCPLHAELDRAYAATEQAFARVRISQLLDPGAASPPLCEHLAKPSHPR